MLASQRDLRQLDNSKGWPVVEILTYELSQLGNQEIRFLNTVVTTVVSYSDAKFAFEPPTIEHPKHQCSSTANLRTTQTVSDNDFNNTRTVD